MLTEAPGLLPVLAASGKDRQGRRREGQDLWGAGEERASSELIMGDRTSRTQLHGCTRAHAYVLVHHFDSTGDNS